MGFDRREHPRRKNGKRFVNLRREEVETYSQLETPSNGDISYVMPMWYELEC